MHLFFVCTGNICRSPSAALVVAERVRRAGLADRVRVTSAGTGPWHVGEPIDRRAGAVLTRRGYPVEHVAAQVRPRDLTADLILAMDRGHEKALLARVGDSSRANDSSRVDNLSRVDNSSRAGDSSRVRLLRSFDPAATGDLEVPDPYYGGPEGFEEMLDMIEAATPGLLAWVGERLGA